MKQCQVSKFGGLNNNVAPYLHDTIFDYIAVGNEAIPGSLGNYVLYKTSLKTKDM